MIEFDDTTNATPTLAPPCPKCQGEMWDNRENKRNPKAPDFKCKDRNCDGVIWPPRTASAGAAPVVSGSPSAAAPQGGAAQAGEAQAGAAPNCPICGGPMWDDRSSKRNPKAPDFKCKNKPKMRGGEGCEGVIWPPRDGKASPFGAPAARPASSGGGAATARPRSSSAPSYDAPPPYDGPPPDDDDILPF